MKKHHLALIGLGVLLVAAAGLAWQGAHAQTRTFALNWSVIGAGGVGSSAYGYTLDSTLGQPVAGEVSESDTTLVSGFWTWLSEVLKEFRNYLPAIMR